MILSRTKKFTNNKANKWIYSKNVEFILFMYIL